MSGAYVKALRGCRDSARSTGVAARFNTETKGERVARSLYQVYLAARLKHGREPVILIDTGGEMYTVFDNDVYAASQHCGIHIKPGLHHTAEVGQGAVARLQTAGYKIVYVSYHAETEGEGNGQRSD